MKLEAEELNMEFLDKALSLSALHNMHVTLSNIIRGVEITKDNAMYMKDTKTAVRMEIMLHYLRRNLDRVEIVMLAKESDIFEFTGYEFICLN